MCQHYRKHLTPPKDGFSVVTCQDCGTVLDNSFPSSFWTTIGDDWSKDRIRKPLKAEPRPMMPSLQPYFQDRMR